MEKIDTEKIKEITNLKVGLTNYESEEFNRMKKLKVLSLTLLAGAILVGGTFTVDAMTDNAISTAVKDAVSDVLKVKVNGQDYNSHCEKLDDGTLKCTVDKEVVGNNIETEVSVEINDEYIDSVQNGDSESGFNVIVETAE